MRLFQCSVLLAVTFVACAKDDKDDDKFSIGLGVLAPSYRQKVGTGKELGAQIDYNQEGKGFSYTVSQGDPNSAPQYSSGPVQYAPQYTPSSSPGVQYAQPAPRYVSDPQYAPAAPQYRPSSISYQPQAALPQVAPQPFGGSSLQSEPQYVPRYQSQSAPARQQAYPSSLAAPETYNAPASGGQGAPQYIPAIQNVRYQFGSGAEPAFGSQLSIFGDQQVRQ